MLEETDTATPPPVPPKTKAVSRPSSATVKSTASPLCFNVNEDRSLFLDSCLDSSSPEFYDKAHKATANSTSCYLRPSTASTGDSATDHSIYSDTCFASRTASATTVNSSAVQCSIPASLKDLSGFGITRNGLDKNIGCSLASFGDFSELDKTRNNKSGEDKISSGNHVVKILINPEQTAVLSAKPSRNVSNTILEPYGKVVFDQNRNDISENFNAKFGQNCIYNARRISDKTTDEKITFAGDNQCITQKSFSDNVSPCIRISVNNNSGRSLDTNMVDTVGQSNPFYFYNPFNGVMSSGQVSPSDTLDSGTCSDMDGTPPPLPKKKTTNGISVTVIGAHKKLPSCSSGVDIDSDNDSNNSSLSCDSLNYSSLFRNPSKFSRTNSCASQHSSSFPQTLLQDIRQRSNSKDSAYPESIVDEKSYSERQEETRQLENQRIKEEVVKSTELNTDMFYKFHLNENDIEEVLVPVKSAVDDESFAGYKDLLGDGASTIRSAKGTVRGVKNRVRAGIATFLQINTNERNYKEKDANKVVVYTTTMGIIRDTYQACMKVKQILRTLLVKFEERDVFMSSEYQTEIRDRMKCDHILVPQVYVDGQHVGDAETIERLNESGELRKLLKPYKSPDACSTCQVCGGYRLLPCHVCNGSKKSVHRNHFTTEFVALKCMSCDDAGLVKCTACSL